MNFVLLILNWGQKEVKGLKSCRLARWEMGKPQLWCLNALGKARDAASSCCLSALPG